MITQLWNLSISSGTFPDTCKIAKLKPLFKKGTRTDPKNYRPISLLPLISKVLTRVIHERTTEFLDKHNILYKFQSGFRKNHSTDFCLSYLTDKIPNGFNSGLLTGMILIDLQKAFDTIDYYILQQKLPSLGFSNKVIDWFKSYLRSRKFHVNVHDKLSTTAELGCGIPQGSILGPLLFLLYINDMPQGVDCDLFLYVDDTCLLYQQKDLDQINKELTKIFCNICDWFVDNKLSIHFGDNKTKSILFSTKKNQENWNIRDKVQQHQYSKVTILKSNVLKL